MPSTTLSSREFNQGTSRAKKVARQGPVFITDRGKPAYVLLTIEDYTKIAGRQVSLAEALAMPRGSDEAIDYEFPRLSDDWGLRIPDFS